MPREQQGETKPAATATVSAHETEVNVASTKLGSMTIDEVVGTHHATPLNAGTLRAAVSTNKPKVRLLSIDYMQ